MSPRRELTLTLLLCAVAALLVLVAAGRVWVVEVVARPAPLPAVRTAHTGGDLRPWLPALGWVALAGAGALVATRAAVRRIIGVLLLSAGGAVAVAAGSAAAGDAAAGWPVLATAGGLGIAAAGGLAVARGARWPALGGRYERSVRSRRTAGGQDRPDQVWDAMDRGEDPTA